MTNGIAAPSPVPGSSTATGNTRTSIFTSTFHARQGCEDLMLVELERLIYSTRLDDACLFCDLFRFSEDRSIYVVHSVWLYRQPWLDKGWADHPAGLGLINQWLLRPIEVIEMEEIA